MIYPKKIIIFNKTTEIFDRISFYFKDLKNSVFKAFLSYFQNNPMKSTEKKKDKEIFY